MKRNILMIAFLATAAFVVGCDKEPTTAQQIDKLKTETKEVAQDLNNYTYAQKAEYSKQMHIQLAALDQELDKLSAKVESSSDAVKAEAKPKLQALREQAARLNKQLDNVKDASESTWDSVKAGSKNAYEALKDGFQQARQWTSDKIAP
ncbi:MAG: hypothetical protein JWR69_4690 [Pedosphaera sp.]|nr:hypothetical protein [Pedosphaera sp.]